MYMAPEMVTSHHYSEKVDVFAMSVMLYEALKCRLNVTRIALGGEPGALQEYADTVAGGTHALLVCILPVRCMRGVQHPTGSPQLFMDLSTRWSVCESNFGYFVAVACIAGDCSDALSLMHGWHAGFREEIPNNWPDGVVSLIRDGWHQVRLQHQLVPDHAAHHVADHVAMLLWAQHRNHACCIVSVVP